jgi:hypothetical protein
MYSFAQREDTRVVDEPLYAHYLARTSARTYHPGATEVLASQEQDGARVVRDIILGPCDRSVLFLKQMTHHLVELDRSFLRQTINVILTRDPTDMLPSYAQQVETPSLADTGYRQHLELLQQQQRSGQQPAILDSRDPLRDPPAVLSQLCDHIGIPYDDIMLHWSAGARAEDGVWAKHWYDSVHRSTGFQPYTPKIESFPPELQSLLKECQPLYEQLVAGAIRA